MATSPAPSSPPVVAPGEGIPIGPPVEELPPDIPPGGGSAPVRPNPEPDPMSHLRHLPGDNPQTPQGDPKG